MIFRYLGRLSGSLLDRIDLQVDVPRVEYDRLMSDERANGWKMPVTINANVLKAVPDCTRMQT